ncbi:MAG: protein kinase [Proteobacteria bacterium]|nr:protein kinase [Pseudomonadota bacterium]MCH8976193.1 protein kinase [Pseudomonadota bacterium]
MKQNITSLSVSELESQCEEYLVEHGEHTVGEFIDDLYHRKRITVNEYKNVMAHEKIELTSFVDVTDTSDNDETEWGNLADVEVDSVKTPWANFDGEDYTILESIDEGAMGEILLAKDNKLNRKVAYKKIHPHVADVPSYLGRFYLEAQVTAQLQHPNIVPIYGFTTSDQSVGYAMKLIDGITLKDHIRETQDQYDKNGEPDEHHSLHARLEHFLKVCDAIHYAHRKGVIHRDLKPLNIMIGPYNEVYVMDWGIAKTVDVSKDMFGDRTALVGHEEVDDEDKTKMGQVMGTPAYMSPEQAGGEYDILDHRSDLYALGLILFELVTLHRAINGKDMDELMLKARRGIIDPAPAYKKQADAQEQLLAIVKKATQYLPEDRYSTVAEFSDDIRRFIQGEAIKARPESMKQKIMRWVAHHQKAAVNIMTYSILASFALVVAVLFQQMESMKVTQSEGEKTNKFITAVANKSQQIDTQFLKYEAILEGLSIGATNLITQGSLDETTYYTDATIADPENGPSDYKFSDVYGFPISVDYHVYKLAPGVDEQKVKPTLQKLNPLRHSFKSLMLKSHKTEVAHDDDKAAHEVIMDEGLPLVWSYIGLEEGIFAEYPGKTGYPEAFDPRQRPWYRGTLEKTGINWLSPYIDVGGRGVLLPCTNPLFDNDGKFIGVAGVEVTLEYVRKKLMPIFAVKGLEETYLLNDKAEIVITSSDKSITYGLGTLINSIDELEVFPNEYVVNKINKGQSGHYFYIEHGHEKIIAYYKLNSIGWYYVAKADAEELLN